jgi:hypothetical protein
MMLKECRLALSVLLFITLQGCATAFVGSAHIKKGPNGCRAICAKWDMEMTGMLAMGEYSDACVCSVRGKDMSFSVGSEGSVAAAAGVISQMRAQQQRHLGY